jgi:hypothetical protein
MWPIVSILFDIVKDAVILLSSRICGFTTHWSWDRELYAYRVFRMGNPGFPQRPSNYCYGPIVQGRLLTHHSGGDHGGGEGLWQGFPSPARCQEELLDPPDLASTMAVACSMFRGKLIGSLGFSHRGEYIGERVASGGGQGGLTPRWRGQGLGRATLGCG